VKIESEREELKKLGRMLMEVLERENERKGEGQMENEEEDEAPGQKLVTTAWRIHYGPCCPPRAARCVVCPGAFIFFLFFCRIPRVVVECMVRPWYFENLDFLLTFDHCP